MKTIFLLPILICTIMFKPMAQLPNHGNEPESSIGAEYRLQIDVLHYSINLEITDFTNQTIAGYTTLQIAPLNDSLNIISLDLLELNIDSVYVENRKTTNYNYNCFVLSVPLQQTCYKSDTTEITVFYNGNPKQDLRWGGFYFTKTHAYNYGVGMMSEPPNFGRVWYPCIDNFTDRATYDYYITVNRQHKAVCCGSLKEVIENQNDTKTYHWRLNHSIPTYLSAVAVADFEVLESTYKGLERDLPVQIFVSDNTKTKAEQSFVNLHEYIRIYENLFGAYQWDRVGYVIVPFFGGAMEHATNIAIGSRAVGGTLHYESLFAHDLSHSWFGNLVTRSTEADMWLNEGWASYCEALMVEHIYGYEAYKEYNRQNLVNVLFSTHVEDMGYRAIYDNPHLYTYSSTVYDKGAAVVHTLRGYLGDSLFFTGVRKYLKDYAFKSITTEEFLKYMTQKTGVDLTDFFTTWVYSPGFPHFSVAEMNVHKNNRKYETQIKIRQRKKELPTYAESNRVEVTFMDEKWNRQTELFKFSGEFGDSTYTLSF